MNRYTYKAKRKDNGEWVYGNAIINPNSTDKIVIVESGVTSYSSTKESILEFINDYVEIIPETLCQCTGLKDRDGNYIFENDIVLITMKDIVKEKGKWITKIIYEENIVCWNKKESGFRFKDKDGIDWIGTDNEVKIIGNKFDKEED